MLLGLIFDRFWGNMCIADLRGDVRGNAHTHNNHLPGLCLCADVHGCQGVLMMCEGVGVVMRCNREKTQPSRGAGRFLRRYPVATQWENSKCPIV